jgi:hypothetical protein
VRTPDFAALTQNPESATNHATRLGTQNLQVRELSSGGSGGAACRNRTDDLLITRKTYTVASALYERF